VVWHLMGHEGLQVRDLLEGFVGRRLLLYSLGEYHHPGKVSIDSFNAIDKARLHYAAGIAMAPYLSLTELPGIAFDRAFRPEIVHEVHYHLHHSLSLQAKNDMNPFRQVVRTAFQRLLRFGEHPGWSIVEDLATGNTTSRDAYEVALDLIEARELSGVPPHPIQLLKATKTFEHRWNDLRGRIRDSDEVLQLGHKIEDLFQQALTVCDRPEWISERDYCRLAVIAQWSLFRNRYDGILQADYGLSPYGAELNSQVWELLAAGVDGSAARGEWFGETGDAAEDHGEAAKVYAYGLRWTPRWYQLWIKYVGCLSLDGKRDEIPKVIEALPREDLEIVLNKAIKGLRKDLKKLQQRWIKARWESGVSEFQSRFGADPQLRGFLKLYADELTRSSGPNYRSRAKWY
jgi:hypothetical protein